jgi:hypothetical protein
MFNKPDAASTKENANRKLDPLPPYHKVAPGSLGSLSN